MFIQCNGPESRTQASIGISRQREAGASTDSEDESASPRSSSSSSSSAGGGGFSFFNAAEAAVVVRCLEQLLLQGGMAAADVCVITPYSGQVSLNFQQQQLRNIAAESIIQRRCKIKSYAAMILGASMLSHAVYHSFWACQL
jgi:hypothetical protein